MINLKQCPFCGGEAEFERVGTVRMSTIVTCTECGSTLESGEIGESAGTRWNDRECDKNLAKANERAHTCELEFERALDMAEECCIAKTIEEACKILEEFKANTSFEQTAESFAELRVKLNAYETACKMLYDDKQLQIERVKELEGDKDALMSRYGDNWYDGFMTAKDLGFDKYSESEILKMSEAYEDEKLKRPTRSDGEVIVNKFVIEKKIEAIEVFTDSFIEANYKHETPLLGRKYNDRMRDAILNALKKSAEKSCEQLRKGGE